jgi:hypothetical protein
MKKALCVLMLAAIVAGLSFAGGSVEAEPVVDSEGYTTVETAGVMFKWKISGGNAEFIVHAPTQGWIGVGFDPSNAMKDANFIIGYVEGGELFIEDHFGDGAFSHRPDTELGGTNDIIEYTGKEDSSGTEITFTIPLDSGDSYDTKLEKGREHVILVAYGPDRSDNFKTKHPKRISFSVTL